MGNYSYYKQQRYKSVDGGVTWEAEDVFQKGAMIEPQNPYMCNPLDRWVEDGWMCDDCPPIPTNYKWLATYATRMSFAECDGTSAITSGEVATTDLVSVSIGDCVTTIGTLAIQRCHSLTSVTIPDSVTSIGSYAFEDCDNLSNVTIGNGLTSIGSYAFLNCESLTSVTIPSGVTTIGDGAFWNCSGLTSVTIPNSVTEIGSHAFAFCIGLASCTIGTSVTSIGDYAFNHCSGLTSVNIPSGVTSIGSYAFYNCNSLSSITVEAITPSTLGTGAFDDTNCPIYVPCDSLAAYQSAWSRYANRIQCIPTPSVYKWKATYNGGTVSSAECDGTSAITSREITLEDLADVEIGDCVTTIGTAAFSECSSLTSVTIPNSVTEIGDYAFTLCSSLTSIDIPNSVTEIGDYALLHCSGLTSITVNATTPPTLGSYAFINTNDCPIYVPSQSVSAYQSASGWSSYASRIQAIPNS